MEIVLSCLLGVGIRADERLARAYQRAKSWEIVCVRQGGRYVHLLYFVLSQ